jgi:hypothetical protein
LARTPSSAARHARAVRQQDQIFAGYGLKIPEAKYDDFADIDCEASWS